MFFGYNLRYCSYRLVKHLSSLKCLVSEIFDIKNIDLAAIFGYYVIR